MLKHKHHIIPRHAGGTDDPLNLVELTVEEHALAHKLLYEKYGKKPAEITYVYSGYNHSNGLYKCKYLHNNTFFEQYGCDLELYNEETEMTADTKTLYSFTVDGNIHIVITGRTGC